MGVVTAKEDDAWSVLKQKRKENADDGVDEESEE
jgi:hypothetical protein